jgi:hypothetical protein
MHYTIHTPRDINLLDQTCFLSMGCEIRPRKSNQRVLGRGVLIGSPRVLQDTNGYLREGTIYVTGLCAASRISKDDACDALGRRSKREHRTD